MIEDAGLEPVHVVHRHGMNLNTAAEVEATLIDCFPGSTNEVAGKGSNERGPANVKQLQNRYERPVMELNSDHKLLFIKTRQQTMEEKGLYEAVRGCWTLTPERAGRADYILAVVDGVCKGVFKADDDGWKPCKRPGQEKRWEFDGREVKGEVADLYVEKLIPADKRKPGMASPYLYENC